MTYLTFLFVSVCTWSTESLRGMGPKCPSMRSFCSAFRELTHTRAWSYTVSCRDCSSCPATPSTCTHTHVWAIASSHIFLSCFNTLSLQPHLPPYLNILQVLYISCVVSIPLTVLNDFKPPSADGVHNGTAVGEELHIADLQQAPIVCKPGESRRKRTRCYRDHGYRLWNLSAEEGTSLHWPFEVVCQTHAKAVGSRLHASANHQPVAGLEDMERTRHSGEGHGAHEYRHILVKTEGRQE